MGVVESKSSPSSRQCVSKLFLQIIPTAVGSGGRGVLSNCVASNCNARTLDCCWPPVQQLQQKSKKNWPSCFSHETKSLYTPQSQPLSNSFTGNNRVRPSFLDTSTCCTCALLSICSVSSGHSVCFFHNFGLIYRLATPSLRPGLHHQISLQGYLCQHPSQVSARGHIMFTS